MNKFKHNRRVTQIMAKVTYAEMLSIKALLESWWATKGLPWTFLQQLDNVAQVVAMNFETYDKMRLKFIDEHAKKGEDGEPLTKKDKDGNSTGEIVFIDAEVATAQWRELMAVSFDCPTLASDDLSNQAEKLSITLGVMRILKPIIE